MPYLPSRKEITLAEKVKRGAIFLTDSEGSQTEIESSSKMPHEVFHFHLRPSFRVKFASEQSSDSNKRQRHHSQLEKEFGDCLNGETRKILHVDQDDENLIAQTVERAQSFLANIRRTMKTHEVIPNP